MTTKNSSTRALRVGNGVGCGVSVGALVAVMVAVDVSVGGRVDDDVAVGVIDGSTISVGITVSSACVLARDRKKAALHAVTQSAVNVNSTIRRIRSLQSFGLRWFQRNKAECRDLWRIPVWG
jgi:hypothetical protein